MSINTRQNIIATATKLFNNKGYSAVNMLEISSEMGISRGNLVYHFKNKEELLRAIADQMWDKLEVERSKSRRMPSFENLHNEVGVYEQFQKMYAFIFLDHLVATHPLLADKFRKMVNQTVQDNEAALAFAIETGNLKPEPFPGVYKNIALSTWMLAFFWSASNAIRKAKPAKGMVEKVIWSTLIPHFTEKGIQSFVSFFGQSYLDSLGAPFDSSIENYITF